MEFKDDLRPDWLVNIPTVQPGIQTMLVPCSLCSKWRSLEVVDTVFGPTQVWKVPPAPGHETRTGRQLFPSLNCYFGYITYFGVLRPTFIRKENRVLCWSRIKKNQNSRRKLKISDFRFQFCSAEEARHWLFSPEAWLACSHNQHIYYTYNSGGDGWGSRCCQRAWLLFSVEWTSQLKTAPNTFYLFIHHF